MVKCVFCGREEKPFVGVHLLKNTGVIAYYCSSKCRKNSLKLERDKRKLKWTESFYISRAKAKLQKQIAKEKTEAEEKLAAGKIEQREVALQKNKKMAKKKADTKKVNKKD